MNLVVVSSVEEACDHIETYGTHHSDCIVTEDEDSKNIFFASIDSACLYHNASTRFTDGFEFGLGAEIGISTQKLHARGPMGLHELTSYAYYLEGEGEIR
jgi:glutamate-5-semialdehyde dehydrogenase